MKNYLVCAIRKVESGWCGSPKHQATYFTQLYKKMYEIRTKSFKKYVREPFEVVLWESTVKDCLEAFRSNWNDIKALWHKEKCNIFWAGADTMMLNPTDLFQPRFREFRMFNYTDPCFPTHSDFPRGYFNDDVAYYPATMSEETWIKGEQLWDEGENHPERNWGFTQIRYNKLFWSQDIPDHDRVHPEMAYQAIGIRSLDPDIISQHDRWNNYNFYQSHIVHFHGSRYAEKVIELMKTLAQVKGIV